MPVSPDPSFGGGCRQAGGVSTVAVRGSGVEKVAVAESGVLWIERSRAVDCEELRWCSPRTCRRESR